MPLTRSSADVRYALYPVTATKSGAAYNPTGDAVQLAFIASPTGPPAPGDWHDGDWETSTLNGQPVYSARVLVGTGGVPLTAGIYYVWLRIVDSPEVPVAPIDTLTIF